VSPQRSTLHVVWDWNGTLLDDADLIISATSASFVAAGHGPVSAADYRSHFVRPLRTFYERILRRPVSEREALDLDASFHDQYLELVGDAVLRPDAIAALDSVQQKTHGQSLLSMWPHEFLVPLVERLELAGYFVRIDGSQRGQAGKTDALGHHLREVGVPPERVVMVGDSVDDAVAAANTGCQCVLVESGHSHADALRETGVPVVADLTEAVRLATS
jgi:phosphoglycolate phosphatase-like HAD superfamily hydrolase